MEPGAELFQRIEQSQADRRRAIIRVISQAVIMALVIMVVSLGVTGMLWRYLHVTWSFFQAIICVSVSMTCTVIGMLIINFWNLKQ